MKSLLSILILFYSISVSLMSQKMNPIEIESNQILNLTADQSWLIIQNWANLNKLVPEVVESTSVSGKGINAEWEINLTNGASIKERMVYFNTNDKTMSYIMTETPMPIEDYLAIIKVEPYGVSKSLVSFNTSCRTTSEKQEEISKTFQDFQVTYLANIEKQLP